MGRDLSTSEKLASRNPARRREGKAEAAKMSSSQRSKTVSKAKSIASRGYQGTVSPSQVSGPTTSQVQQAQQAQPTKAAPRTMVKAAPAAKAIVPQKQPSRFVRTYRAAEETVARYVTRPVARGFAKVGITKEKVAKTLTEGFGYGAVQRVYKYGKRPKFAPSKKTLKVGKEFQMGFVKGIATGLQKKPVKTAAIGAAFYAFPKVTGYAGLGVAKAAPAFYIKAAPAAAAIGKGASVGLASAYVVGRGKEAYRLPPGEARGKFVGETVSTEVAPALLGGFRGGRAATSVREKASVIATAKTQLSPGQQKEFFKTLKLAKTAKGKISKVYRAPIEQVLPRKEAGITRQWLAGRGKKAIVYGSVAQKTQVTGKVLRQMRPSGDIDIAVKYPHRAAVDYSTAIYKATGVKPKIPMKALARGGAFGPGQEASVFVKGKAVTFHTKTSLEASPFYQGKPRKTPAGVYVQRIEEQLGRKVAGAMVRGRAKDIPDYRQIAKSVSSQLKQQAPFRVRKGLAKARVKGFEKVAKLPKMPAPKTSQYYSYPKPSYYTPAYAKYPAGGMYTPPKATYPAPTYRQPIPPRPSYPTPAYRPPVPSGPTPPYRTPTPSTPTPPYRPPTTPTTPPYRPPTTPPTTTPPYSTPPTPTIPPYRPPPTPPYIPRRRGRVRRARPTEPVTFRQPRAYAPTLRAAVFSIKAPKGMRKKKLTGLEERGIL